MAQSRSAAFAAISQNAPASGDARIDALLFGTRWSGHAVSYSAPDSGGDYADSYAADDDRDGIPAHRDGFSPLGARQIAAMHAVLNADAVTQRAAHAGFSVEGFTGLAVAYAGNGAPDGILRYANSADAAAPANTAYSFFPSERDTGGDVWFDGSGRQPVAGNYDYLTLLHETGHALGLKHGHEGTLTLPAALDSLEFTVMTYRSHVGAPTDYYRTGPVDYPQTWMMLDIAALQHLYGADFTTRSGDTTYSWNSKTGATSVDGAIAIAPAGNRVFITLWDGGGTDTYDLSAYATDLSIDLRPGEASTFATRQLADLGGGPNGGHARANLFNALQYQGDARSLIENARGGKGDDWIGGNDAANRLEGGGGGDRLLGRDGADRMLGGAGADTLVGGRGADWLTGGSGRDCFEFTSRLDSLDAGTCDVITDFAAPGSGEGDLIDLAAVDARDGKAGDQAFIFGGTGKGHLRLFDDDGYTLACADTGGSSAWDFVIRIADESSARAALYTAGDFIL